MNYTKQELIDCGYNKINQDKSYEIYCRVNKDFSNVELVAFMNDTNTSQDFTLTFQELENVYDEVFA